MSANNANYQYKPQRKPLKRLAIVVSVLIGLLALGGVIYSGLGGGSKAANDKLVKMTLGRDASMLKPASFIQTDTKDSITKLESPKDIKNKEQIKVELYDYATPGYSKTDATTSITQNTNGKISGQTSKIMTRAEQDTGKGEQQILVVVKKDAGSKTITSQYYYFYDDKIWLATIKSSEGSFLSASADEIAKSFKSGGL